MYLSYVVGRKPSRMSKQRKKQIAVVPDKDAEFSEPNSVTLPLELGLSLLRPDEVEKLKRYIAKYAGEQKSEESKEPLMVLITKPFLVKLQSSVVQELAILHHCTLRISEWQPDAHIVTFPVDTCLAKGEAHRYPLHLPDGYICTLVWNDGYFHWYEETVAQAKEKAK